MVFLSAISFPSFDCAFLMKTLEFDFGLGADALSVAYRQWNISVDIFLPHSYFICAYDDYFNPSRFASMGRNDESGSI